VLLGSGRAGAHETAQTEQERNQRLAALVHHAEALVPWRPLSRATLLPVITLTEFT